MKRMLQINLTDEFCIINAKIPLTFPLAFSISLIDHNHVELVVLSCGLLPFHAYSIYQSWYDFIYY